MPGAATTSSIKGESCLLFALTARPEKFFGVAKAPRPRMERYQKVNAPASPSAVTDGTSVFVFFADYGIISYTKDGDER